MVCAIGFVELHVENFKNESGLVIQALIDLQRFMGCKLVADDQPVDMFVPVQKKEMKLRVAETDKFSARVNLLFRSNPTLKTRGFKIQSIQSNTKFSNCSHRHSPLVVSAGDVFFNSKLSQLRVQEYKDYV